MAYYMRVFCILGIQDTSNFSNEVSCFIRKRMSQPECLLGQT